MELEHCWLVYHGYFKLDLEFYEKNPIATEGDFLVTMKLVYCVCAPQNCLIVRLNEAILMPAHNIPSC